MACSMQYQPPAAGPLIQKPGFSPGFCALQASPPALTSKFRRKSTEAPSFLDAGHRNERHDSPFRPAAINAMAGHGFID